MKKINKALSIASIIALGTNTYGTAVPAKAVTTSSDSESTTKKVKEPVNITSNTTTYKEISTSKLKVGLSNTGQYSMYLLPNNNRVFYNGSSANASVYTNQELPTTASYPATFTGMATKSFSINSKNEIELVKEDNYFIYTLRISIVNATSEGGYLKVEMEAVNKTTSTQSVAISFNMDTAINNNDTSPFIKYENSWEAYSGDVKVTGFFKDTFNVTNADYIYLGRYNAQTPNPLNYYTNGAVINPGDSGAGIYYKNRPVNSGQSRKESFILGIGARNTNPTFTLDNNQNNQEYYIGQDISVAGKTKDIDVGDELTLNYAIDDEDENVLKTFIANGNDQTFSDKITIPNSLSKGTHTITTWVTDDIGGVSQAYKTTFIVNDVQSPKLSFNNITNDSVDISLDKLANKDDIVYELVNETTNETFYLGNNLTHKITGLDSGTTYKFKVRAKSPYGEYSTYNSANMTTLVNPTDATVTSNGKGTINLGINTDNNSSNVSYKYTVINADTKAEVLSNIVKTKENQFTLPTDKHYEVYLDVLNDKNESNGDSKLIGTIYDDTIAPDKPSIDISNENPTNKNVTVSIEYPTDSKENLYRINNGEWKAYTNPIEISENSLVEAKSIDTAKNESEISQYNITNIDKTVPENPVIVTSTDNPTNKDVTVLINYSDDSTERLYRINNGEWKAYTGEFDIPQNAVIEAKSLDNATNESGISQYNITNIDKIAPENPNIHASTENPTNKDVTISIDYPNDSNEKLYRINNGEWKSYTNPIDISANALVEAKSIDNAKNESEIVNYKITNIDKTVPENPVIQSSNESPTNKNVMISIQYPDDSNEKLYRINNGEWKSYSNPIEISENSLIEAKSIDNATNESKIVNYKVTNIDKTAPENPVINANTKNPTNKDVTISINYSEDSKEKFYRINNGEWKTYTGEFNIPQNAVIEAKSLDNVGNESEIVEYKVTNIDKTAPENPSIHTNTENPTNKDVTVSINYSADSKEKLYRINSGEWKSYSGEFDVPQNSLIEAKSLDNANNESEIVKYNITNIDKIVPENPVIVTSTDNPTNKDVKVLINYSDDSTERLYRINNGEWKSYTGEFDVPQNALIEAKSLDNATNESGITQYYITNIDKIAPENPIIHVSTERPTNKNVMVSIDYPADSEEKLYRINNGEWKSYTNPIEISENSLVETKSIDNAKNESEIVEYKVTNIDKIVPENPIITPNTKNPTNKDVTISIDYPNDSNEKLYRINNGEWKSYNNPIDISANALVEAKSIDNATNESGITQYNITNIDKILPENPVIHASTTNPTNKDVAVTIDYSNDSVIKQYRIDNGEWKTYTGEFNVAQNAVIEAKALDNATNESKIIKYVINNIDKVPPQKPIVSADKTDITNQHVIITPTYSNDSVQRLYRINDGDWEIYSGHIEVAENKKVDFKSIDNAGNESEITSYIVSNIDTVPPEKPIISSDTTKITNKDVKVSINYSDDSDKKYYRINKGDWIPYNGSFNVEENAVIDAYSEDTATNKSAIDTYEINNIDKIAPENPNIHVNTDKITNQDVLVNIDYHENNSKKQYRINDEDWLDYTGVISVSKNATIYSREMDEAGNISNIVEKEITNIDKSVPDVPIIKANTDAVTNKDVTISIASKHKIYYKIDNGQWQEYLSPFTVDKNAKITSKVINVAGTESLENNLTVTNIDKVKPSIIANISDTSPTNKDVILSTFADDNVQLDKFMFMYGNHDENTVLNEGKNIEKNTIVATENTPITIVAKDTAGNVERKMISIDNIDKIPPEKPSIYSSNEKPTNKNVFVSVNYSDDANEKLVKIGENSDWIPYTKPLEIEYNEKIYAKSIDKVGNVSDVSEYSVKNIDKVVPEKPEIIFSSENPTNKDVLVTINSKDVGTIEYKLDDGDWNIYEKPFDVSKNTKIISRITDDVGNTTDEVTRTISNIDKISPKIKTSLSETNPINKDITLNLDVSDNVEVKEVKYLEGDFNQEDVLKNGIISSPNGKIVIDKNKTISIATIDTAGNISYAKVTINNIDKEKPENPLFKPEITTPTNKDVKVKINYPDDAYIKHFKYSLNDEWLDYKEDLVIKDNQHIYAQAIDNAGNKSDIVEYVVNNIDREAPNKPNLSVSTDKITNKDVQIYFEPTSDKIEYKIIPLNQMKNSRTLDADWTTYSKPFMVDKNATVLYRISDVAGNVSDTFSKDITNIDKTNPDLSITADNENPTNKDVQLKINALDNVAVDKIYYLDKKGNLEDVLMNGKEIENNSNITIDENKTVTFVVLDTAGNTSLKSLDITNIDKKIPEKASIQLNNTNITNQDVVAEINFPDDAQDKFYRLGEDSHWMPYTNPITITKNTKLEAYSKDAVGNDSEITSYSVENIDKNKPSLHVMYSTKNKTNKDVLLNIQTNDLNKIKEIRYLLDKKPVEDVLKNGILYDKPIKITKNTPISIVVIDDAGNISYSTYSINNIDKSKPTKPSITFNKVKDSKSCEYNVNITYSKDSVGKYYSIDNGNKWLDYKKDFVVACSVNVMAKSVNKLGTESKQLTKSAPKHTIKVEKDTKPVLQEVPKKMTENKLPKTGQEGTNQQGLLFGLTSLLLGLFFIRRNKKEMSTKE